MLNFKRPSKMAIAIIVLALITVANLTFTVYANVTADRGQFSFSVRDKDCSNLGTDCHEKNLVSKTTNFPGKHDLVLYPAPENIYGPHGAVKRALIGSTSSYTGDNGSLYEQGADCKIGLHFSRDHASLLGVTRFSEDADFTNEQRFEPVPLKREKTYVLWDRAHIKGTSCEFRITQKGDLRYVLDIWDDFPSNN